MGGLGFSTCESPKMIDDKELTATDKETSFVDTLLFSTPTPCTLLLAGQASSSRFPNITCASIIESSFVFSRKQMTENIYGIFDNWLQSELHRTENWMNLPSRAYVLSSSRSVRFEVSLTYCFAESEWHDKIRTYKLLLLSACFLLLLLPLHLWKTQDDWGPSVIA